MIRWFLLLTLALIDAAQAQGPTDCIRCPEMVNLPAGAFIMGPAPGEEDREEVRMASRDGPAHPVIINYSFAIGKYEITRDEFAAFIADTGWQTGNSCWGYGEDGEVADVLGLSWRNPGFSQTGQDPVVCVSWDDANAYAAWLGRMSGRDYRLPSEAEWEYAARAGSQAARYWGDSREPACHYGNFADLTAASTFDWDRKPEVIFMCPDGYVYTAPIGRFQPNAFGLHDMLGNASEWTLDCHNSSYDGAPTDGRAWLAGRCTDRIQRGGSWGSGPWRARAAFRRDFTADNRDINSGFRVARSN